MSILSVLVAPDPRLRKPARPVASVDARIRRLMDDMLETMYAAPGVGLAAPQVGESVRVLVLDSARAGEAPQPLRVANPEIVWEAAETVACEEGCLSFPDQYSDVERPREVKVRYLDHENEMRELHATGVLAVCLQHEMDHLDGVLFVDHISALRRGIIMRRLSKLKKAKAVPAPA